MTTPYIIKELQDALTELEQLQAVETLEYLNKNWLASPKSACQQKASSLKYIRLKVERIVAVLEGKGEKP